METEGKKHKQFTKRRERRAVVEGSADEMDGSPSRPSNKDKQRSKYRRKKSGLSFEEDIIDGFAIISFKSLDDLETVVKKNALPNKTKEKKEKKPKDKQKKERDKSKKKEKKLQNSLPTVPSSPAPVKAPEESLDCSPRSDATEVLDFHDGTRVSPSPQLSDVSSHSTSDKGYQCDSESGDDRASDAGSDIFTAAASTDRTREHIPGAQATCSTVVTTAISASTTCISTAASSVTTCSIISTTTVTTNSAILTLKTNTSTVVTTTTCSVTTSAPIPSVIPASNKALHASSSPALKRPLPSHSPVLSNQKQAIPPHPRPASALPHSSGRDYSRDLSRDLGYKVPSSSPLSRVHNLKSIKREDTREKDFQLPPSLPGSKPWLSSSSHSLYNNPISPSPGLYPLHSSSSHGPPYGPSSLSQAPEAHNHGHPGHSMFATPLPHGPVGAPLSATGLSGNSPAGPQSQRDSMSLADQELLRTELNRRFLDIQSQPSAGSALGGHPPFVRADIHQHQHQHMHQHQHTHQHHMYTIPYTASLGPQPTPLLYDKVPKIDSPFFRQNIPGLSTYPHGVNPLVPSQGTGPLNSGIPGAFQPKRVTSSLHPAQMMLASMRTDRDKSLPSAVPSPHAPNKKGKWCAVHVSTAWKIFQHQQKHLDIQKNPEGKSLEPLRPPSHLTPGSSLGKATDLTSTSSLYPPGLRQGLRETSPHAGFLNPNPLSMPPFPRPMPYSTVVSSPSALGSFGGLGISPFGPGRDVPGIPPSPSEWNRLHRTPSSFPTPAAYWAKSLEESKELDRERELERHKEKEKERETLLGIERRREEERERERRNSERDRFSASLGLGDRSHDRDKLFHNDLLRPSRSRSRSRSPLQNGGVGSAKSTDSVYDRRLDDRSVLKIKEERRDEEVLHPHPSDRDKLRGSELFSAHPLLDRSSLFAPGPPSFLPGDRVSSHLAMMGTLDKGPLDIRHGLNFQDLDRDPRLISRIPPVSLHSYDPHRAREQELLAEECLRRDFYERMYDKDRLALLEHQSRLRSAELASNAHLMSRTPLINSLGIKGSSPACPPPPLIPSSSATSRSHSNSPAVRKSKSHHGSVESLGDKREPYMGPSEHDSHSR